MSNLVLIDEGKRFAFYSAPFGSVKMVRKSDGESRFFQGEDACEMRAELEAAQNNADDLARLGTNPVDRVCDDYF